MNILPVHKLKEFVPKKSKDADYFSEEGYATGSLRTNLNATDIGGKLDALNRILAMSSTGAEISQVFPDVVRQLFVSDPQVKRLTHICLNLHADENPEIVLLCINALQKDLMDIDPLTRGVAVRTMCGIRNQEVSDHALVTIHKGSTDSSVYVRKCAAVSIAKYVRMQRSLNHTDRTELLGNLDRLLSDYEPTVVSVALMSFWLLMEDPAMTQGALSMLHGHFTRIVSMLPAMDWTGQFFGIHVCFAYCVSNFSHGSSNSHLIDFVRNVQRIAQFSLSGPVVQVSIACLADLGHLSEIDPEPILASRLASLPEETLEFFLPVIGMKRIKPFLINIATDSEGLKLRKLRILRLSLTQRNAEFLLSETGTYLRSSPESREFIHECVAMISEIGFRYDSLQASALQLLVSLIGSHNGDVSAEAVAAVRASLESQGIDSLKGEIAKKVLILLCNIVGSISSSKASALWLIRLCHNAAPIVVPNVLREVAKELHQESGLVKFELFSLAITVLNFHRKNASDSSQKTSVPPAVSLQLVPPIEGLVKYIGQIATRDPLVGDLVKVLRVTGETAVSHVSVARHMPSPVHSVPICPSLGRVALTRAEVDSSDTLRESKQKVDRFESKSLSSSQAVNNRTSSSVTVPTTLKQAPPKPVTTLEDLDLFFTTKDSVLPKSPDAEEVSSLSQGTSPEGKTKKAAIDLSNADWLKL